jgi:hypothetical protein
MNQSQRRIAMWSPPRARSTMMMRVFEALGCAAIDEPFYPYWLKTLNKVDDPGFRAALDHHETDWQKIIELVLGPIPDGRQWYYQKHMATHMLDEVDLQWMHEVRNCFLIRNPAEVIVSMSQFRNLEPGGTQDLEAAAKLVGIPQLRRIFDRACEISDGIPLVIDANDVLRDPRRILGGFCAAVGLDFDPDKPIKWAPGKHEWDGAWADDWYGSVFKTTSLGPYQPQQLTIPPELQPVVDFCMPVYEHIAQYKIT